MEQLVPHVVPFLLVLTRLAGLFVLGPYLSGLAVPVRIKVLVLVTMAVAIYPVVPLPLQAASEFATLDVFSLMPLVGRELLIGVVIGFIASLPLMALESAGVVVGQQMGFGLARIYNPDINIDADLIGQMLFYVGAGIFLSTGGLNTMFLAVVRTFEHVPAGGMTSNMVPLTLILQVLTSGLELTMRVSAPVIGIVLLLVVLFGAIGKTMPQINIMSVGFSFKIIAGVAMLALSLYAVDTAAGDEVADTMDRVVVWAESLRSAGAVR
jgi:flagellar biosynthetic protein FliR